jgi:hypothetical protein
VVASFVTEALTDAIPFAAMLAGGCWVMAIDAGAVMVIATVAGFASKELFSLYACELAVIVTGLPAGIAEGAVKMVPAALAVVTGLKEPHAPAVALPHVAIQSTPALVESPVTVALMVVPLPVANDVAGCEIVTEITGEVVTVAAVEALVEPSFADVAVILTVPPAGTKDGAV